MRLRWIAAVALISSACIAHADNIQTLGEYNGTGTFNDPGPYQPSTVIGTFNILPGDSAITISGTFGNSTVGSSSGVDVYLGNVLVAQCVELAACYTSGDPTAWSDTLSAADISSLGTGTVDLTAVQTSQFTIRLGTTTLDQSAATPEPSSFALLGTGLLGFAGVLRRRFHR